MYLLMAQLAILAIYSVILIASLLADHRRPDTAGLLSRGAGPSQVGFLALAEGILIAIPAAVLGPWLAVAAVAILNVVGPLADVGLDTQPRVTVEGYLAAGAIAIVCVALLVLPSMLSARSLSAEQRGLTRHETRTLGQRMGLDIALLAISCIALWQLRLYGAPLTRTVQGSLGIDPLLVVAPAISLLAGGVLALRILPLLAQGAEAVVSRRRDLVATLGSRQLARRPLRYTRSALLLMIAVSMGVLTVSYAATWSSAQRDQAAYQAGADVRVVPGDSPRRAAALGPARRLCGAAGHRARVAGRAHPGRVLDRSRLRRPPGDRCRYGRRHRALPRRWIGRPAQRPVADAARRPPGSTLLDDARGNGLPSHRAPSRRGDPQDGDRPRHRPGAPRADRSRLAGRRPRERERSGA